VDSEAVSEVHNIWGFDMLYFYKAPLPALGVKDPLHQTVVLRIDSMDREADDGDDEPESFLQLEYIPFGGLRWQRTCIASPGGSKVQLVRRVRCGGIYGYRVADVMDDWREKADHFMNGVEFATEIAKACNAETDLADHFREARVEVKAWHDDYLEKERARKAALASTVATGALLLCTVQ